MGDCAGAKSVNVDPRMEIMSQNTSIYWKNEETAHRARWMAKAEDLSVSQFVSALINEHYNDLYPEPPIRAHCTICGRETEFVFMAYWEEQSNLYQCVECGKVIQENSLNNGHKMANDRKMEAQYV